MECCAKNTQSIVGRVETFLPNKKLTDVIGAKIEDVKTADRWQITA